METSIDANATIAGIFPIISLSPEVWLTSKRDIFRNVACPLLPSLARLVPHDGICEAVPASTCLA